ncbi:MAG: GMC family oxidoreductase [Hyphomicrobiaceae bacterium]
MPGQQIETADFVIVGGGSAGAIIARRLAERTSGRIVLIEAGPSDEHDPTALYLSKLDEQQGLDWGFKATTCPGAPAQLKYLRARMLGGCGNHNDCAYLIPPDHDFEQWEQAGAKGWGPDGVSPYFRRIDERVNIYRFEDINPICKTFVAAGRELGYPERDFRAGVADGIGYFPLNSVGDLRHSSSVAYLHPVASLPKHLEVWTGTMAEKIVIENGRAVGVVTSRGTISARREVILTAGSLQTPQLLMVSGIGPAAELHRHGIGVVRDLPGVGNHLLDHVAAPVIWQIDRPVGPWQITHLQTTMLISIDKAAPAPDVLFHFGLRIREKYDAVPIYADVENGVRASPNVARARSTGRVTLASADIQDAPVIDLNYFSDPEGYDLRILREALKFSRRFATTKAFGSMVVKELAPGPDVLSDADLEAYMRQTCETVYHPSGTAVMGDPSRKETVVGPDLRVKGVDGLRVCDASVFPTMVTVNINNTVMMIAEKAADLILAAA